jgi:acetyl/propionyl-CoA carboxylase alpha subunit
MKKLSFEIDGKEVEGITAFSRGTLWVHMKGQTFTLEVPKRVGRRGGRSTGTGANPGEVTAPMPGKIIKLMVKEGDTVAAQQVLLVMEAMKMEYTLKALSEGKVSQMKCTAGDQVSLGQLLVKLDLP